MRFRKKALIFFSTLMGVVWVVLLFVQLRLTNRVLYNEKEMFHTKVDMAITNALEQLEDYPLNEPDTSIDPLHLSFEEYYPFLQLPENLSDKVNRWMDYIVEAKPCLNSCDIDSQLFDSVFSSSLHQHQIFDLFKWGLYCSKDSSFLFVSEGTDTAMLASAGFEYPLLAYTYPAEFHNDFLLILFPELERHYSWDMYMGVILLSVLLVVILICFLAVIIMIIRESRAVRLRSNVTNHIIHELKTPITTINLATQLLKDDSVQKDQETTDSYLNIIEAESKSLQSLVEEVLFVFRTEQLPTRELHLISVHELLQTAVKVHQFALDECKAEVNLDFGAEADEILGDRIHLLNAMSNLIDNAIKYRNGELVINIVTRNIDNAIEIQFQDNGIGISKDHQKMIFEPFSRVNTDNANYVKGYGLGLSYVRFVVRYHGGKIKVVSELGEGATFILSLPVKNK